MTPLEREMLRVYVDAERAVAEVVDPGDTMTVLVAITGHEQLVADTYQRMLREDGVVRAMQRAPLSSLYHVGQECRAWSERVFGVPVHFTITKVGTKLLHGTFSYNGVTWTGKIPPERLL